MTPKNIIVRKGKKIRRAREADLNWFKQRGWLPDSSVAASAGRGSASASGCSSGAQPPEDQSACSSGAQPPESVPSSVIRRPPESAADNQPKKGK